jgi:hypothetical protein
MPKRGSCGSVLRCGSPPLEPMPTINPPTARWCTPRAREMPATLSLVTACRHARRLVLVSRLSSRAAPTRNSYSARCLAGAKLPATSCLGAFWTPADRARAISSLPASKNLHTSGHTKTSWATSSPTGGDQAHFRRARIARPITQSLSLSDRKLSSSVKWVTRWR